MIKKNQIIHNLKNRTNISMFKTFKNQKRQIKRKFIRECN